MSVDRSLKIRSALSRHRNVLTRAERILKLKDEERWAEEESVFGLPKVANRKSHAAKKEKAAKPEGEAATAAAGAPADAAAKAPAAGKPATGAKPAPEAKKPAGKAKG